VLGGFWGIEEAAVRSNIFIDSPKDMEGDLQGWEGSRGENITRGTLLRFIGLDNRRLRWWTELNVRPR
jgi:hypothetical protein